MHGLQRTGRAMMDGAALIFNERQRQVQSEGWTAEHDAQYEDDELLDAAMCYMNADIWTPDSTKLWPWPKAWFKPTTTIRNLVKAAALIAAEIDRLQNIDNG